MKPDPYFHAGVNLLAYVLNNAVTLIDRVGAAPQKGGKSCPDDLKDNPKYKTGFLSFGGGTNCWNYGLNKPFGPLVPSAFPPGEEGLKDCSTLMRFIRESPEVGAVDPDGNGCCPPGTHKIKVVLAPGNDFHVYRQDADGTWSHVLGHGGDIQKPIPNIETQSNNWEKLGAENYTEDCGCICVRTTPTEKELQTMIDYLWERAYRDSLIEAPRRPDTDPEDLRSQFYQDMLDTVLGL